MVLAFLVGTSAMLGSLLSYGMATDLIVRVVVRLIRCGYTGVRFWEGLVVMTIVTVFTAAAHLAQIALWSGLFLVCGQVETFDKAFYFSAQNYTSLGYGDVVLTSPWRILGPLEAISGLLLFGLSTAIMFAVLSRLITNRLEHQQGDLNETMWDA